MFPCIQKMQTMEQQLVQWRQLAYQLALKADPALAQRMAADAAAEAGQEGAENQGGGRIISAPTESTMGTADAAHMVKARETVRDSTMPE